MSKSSDGQVYETLVELKKTLEKALALIFHRFLSASGSAKLKIQINNQSVKPLDPFLERHPKTSSKKERTIAINDSEGVERLIYIKPFVLPFATDLSDNDKKLIGGIENLRAKQGFYVYRNNRLIIWGTWFGMRLGELTKNARIRVDIPNSLDDIWGIDITKRTATIPKNILNQLRKTVKDAMDIATRKQTHRGRKENVDANISYIWNRMQGRNNNFYYELNKENPLFKNVKDHIPADYHSYIDIMLDEIQLSIPIQQIYI